MTHACPVCKRSFAEPGYCPFDGKHLVPLAVADKPTVISAFVTAQTDVAASPAEARTQPAEGKTQPETRTEPGLGETTNKLHALSAHTGKAEALATMRKRDSDYDQLVGETLDKRYYVERKIGEGGMGVVFAVKHAVIERPLAIKVLKREVMRDNATVQRFIQEAKAASRIGHPNIVDVTDFGKTPDGMTYSVMEYIEGTTLSRAIKDDAPFPPQRVVRIGSQIARALAAAHGKGIVHRDLKPENVFLIERDGRPDFVKIVDFGIAKVQPVEGVVAGPRLTRAGAVFGTPEYMAPEQAAGRGDTDHRVDIYALGTILYEMIVGKVPHKGESMVRTIAMQMLDPITPPSKVNPDLGTPPQLEAIVMKALEKKRDDRFSSMNELLAALEATGPQLAAAAKSPLSLPPLPPGADPNLTPAQGARVVTAADTAPRNRPATAEAAPRKRPPTRPLHEPEFAAPGGSVSAGSVSFTHVYDAEEPPESSRRWPMIIAGIVMLVLGAGGAILLIRATQRDDAAEAPARAADAAVIAELRDAAIVEVPVDAPDTAELPIDAGTRAVATTRRDAGASRPDRRIVTVEIMTRPGDAEVFIGRNYRGPGGVRIAEPYGTKRKIECKTDRMKGSVEVVFDGSKTAVMCTATRDRFCVPGLKNPYDDCEEDPNSPLVP